MSQIPAIGLVVVQQGVAEPFSPEHVRVEIVDIDKVVAGDGPHMLPMGMGFEALVKQAGVEEYVYFDLESWREHPDFPVKDWQNEVLIDYTRLGYADWVKAKVRESQEERKDSDVS